MWALDLTPICAEENPFQIANIKMIISSFFGRPNNYNTRARIIKALAPYTERVYYRVDNYMRPKFVIKPRGLETIKIEVYI